MTDGYSRRRFIRQLGAATAAVTTIGDRPSAAAAPEGLDSAPAAGATPIDLRHSANPYGASPRALTASRESASSVNAYPDDGANALRQAVAGFHGIDQSCVVLGSGSTELLRAAVRLAAVAQGRLVLATPTCGLIAGFGRDAGLTVDAVPLRPDHAHDLDRMLAHAGPGPSVIYLCNPNSPTGTLTRRQDIEQFLRRVPRAARVVIDEAYYDYVEPSPDHGSFLTQAATDPRLIVTRSFSKIHGLAGLRVGYAVSAEPTAGALAAACLPFGVSVSAAAAAAAALEDTDSVRQAVARNADDRQEFQNQVNARMLRSLDSQANFVLLDTGREAQAVVEHFRRHGVRMAPPVPGMPSQLRVALGTAAQMAEFWRVWDLMPGGHMVM